MQFLNTLYFNEPAKFMTLHLLPHETNLILMFFLKTTNLINSPLTVGMLGIKAAGIIVRFNSASLTGINNWLSIAKPKFSDLLVI